MSDTAAVTVTVQAMGQVFDAEGNLLSESPVTLTGTMTREEAEARGIEITDEEQ
jgi:hypothetical protein